MLNIEEQNNIEIGKYCRMSNHYKRKAFECIREAASLGEPKAQYQMYLCYSQGTGVRKDWNKAIEWLKRSANNDEPKAQYEMGNLCLLGLDSFKQSKNDVMGFIWDKMNKVG